jgi:hypothetical protein
LILQLRAYRLLLLLLVFYLLQITELFLDRSCGLVDFECVLNKLPSDTRHIGWTRCEDISVVPKEASERDFLFGVEVGPDDDYLGCTGQAEANFLDGWTWV